MNTQLRPSFGGKNLLKFRPVLTLSQIQRISDLVHASDAEIDKSIKRVLIPLIAKVEVSAINPAYKLSEIYAEKQAATSQRTRYENGEMDAAEEAEYESKILGV